MDLSKDITRMASALAIRVHEGQVDKCSEPYMGHVERVVTSAYDFVLEYGGLDSLLLVHVVGLLHDVVEDSDVLIEEIFRDFGSDVRNAVDAITHRPNEPYWNYITRCGRNRVATAVKLADIVDNFDINRGSKIMNHREYQRWSQVLVPRYMRAYRYLLKCWEDSLREEDMDNQEADAMQEAYTGPMEPQDKEEEDA